MKHTQTTGLAWLRAAATAATIGLVSACGGGGGDSPGAPDAAPTPAPPSPPAAALKVIPARANLNVDAQITLAPFGAAGTVTWTSNNPAVATVDAAGRVSAVAPGNAVITASAATAAGSGASTSAAAISVWRSTGPNADASAESLIAAAQTAGRISAEQALVYQVYARFADDRLPPEYQGPSDPGSAVSLRHVSGQLPQLSAATQDLLLPFLLPPIYAQSWFAQQLGAAAPAKAAKAAARLATSVPCSFAAYPLPVARRTTAHFAIHSIVSSPLWGEEAMLDYIASVVEPIDTALTGLLRRAPKSDVAEGCNGGDGAFDIYLSPSFGSEVWAETVTYPGRCENTPAYIVINKAKFLPWEGDAGQLESLKRRMRTVLTHELTHAIQFAMDRNAACADYTWIDEATAQWAPDHVFKDDNQEDGFNKLGLANAYRTGTYYVDYLKGGHRESIEKANGYSTYIYFQFLAGKYGATAIKTLFDTWPTTGSVASLDALGTRLRDAWPEFGKALWNDIRDNVLTDLRDWDNYDYGMANVTGATTLVLDGSGRSNVILLQANNSTIAPRSLAYERLVFSDESVSGVLLTNPLGSLPQSVHLKLIAVKKIDGQWKAPEDWTGDPTKFFCRDKAAERLQELVLIVSNSDSDPDAEPVLVPADQPLAVSSSNVGCWKWQGSATQQTISDNGISSGELTARAVNVVLDPPADYQGLWAMTLAATNGTASGLLTLTTLAPPCHATITGRATLFGPADVGAVWFNLDLKQPGSPLPPSREVVNLQGMSFIDSTSVTVCSGQITTTPAPSTAWAWLMFPLITNPLSVAADGKTIEANVTINVANARTVHNFKFTAMRE